MNSTRQSTDTDATADKQITSVVNCTTRVSVAGVSGINGGTNTTTAGTRTAIGTITTTTKQLWSAPFHGFVGLLAIDRHNTSVLNSYHSTARTRKARLKEQLFATWFCRPSHSQSPVKLPRL
jgi:hypothetical protein